MNKILREQIAIDSVLPAPSIPLRVLILEDDPRDAELSIRELSKAGFEVQSDVVDTQPTFAAKLRSQYYDIILADYQIPTWSGLRAFHLLKETKKDIPFIVVTGTLGEEAAVDLIKEGITDYILKDRLVRLPFAIRRALQEKSIRNERERAMKALRESEEQVRLLLASTAEAICGTNAHGNCTFCNPACVRLLGYDDPEELLGKNMHSLVHHTRSDGTPYPVEECQMNLSLREGKGSHVDNEVFWRKDGSSFPAEYWSYPVFQDQKLIGSVVTFLDITERKAAKALLLQKIEELNRSNKELEQFLYVGSHDLQEPLRMVTSYTQLLSKRYRGKLDSDADEFIDFAVDGASRMQRSLQDLLAYSRVGTKGKALVDTSSEDAFQRALINLRGPIEESGAQVTHDPLPRVLADEAQLIQLFQNLIGNAIKYKKPGAPRVHVSAARNGGKKWIFSVKDNGLGIDPQYFGKIFGIFQRLHGPKEFGGTGVGLAICKKIVERHGGSISVESQPGEGSTFRFDLADMDAKPLVHSWEMVSP